MRRIFLDTETTGLSPDAGHRVVEIAAVVYENHLLLAPDEGGRFHVYLNPEREVDEEAREVHGLDAEFLGDKPLFREVAEKFVDFLQGGHLYIHNAKFDLDFLNAELGRLDFPPVEECCETVVCTLEWSRQNNRGIASHSLDALCRQFGVDSQARERHSALLDTQLLAQVFFQMTRRQMDMDISRAGQGRLADTGERRAVRVFQASAAEVERHQEYLARMEKESGVRPLFERGGD